MFFHLGRYFILMSQVFKRPDKGKILRKLIITEIDNLGLDSLGIVVIISVFMGAVVALQTAANIDSPLMPIWSVGFTARQSVILEFSPTIVSLILAGKVGSRISSEIGTMRVTEQIDALDIMGVNSANYLIMPKIIASLLINPILIIISMFLGIFGGWLACILTGLVTSHNYVYGVQIFFEPFHVFYAIIKTIVFAFLIASVSGYNGYYTSGGALEVGRSSTKAVVFSSIMIILFNLILTKLLL
ncbi:MAG: ABC transporter permease [Bacteroidetes bacterium]|jgi:phospholipid/cholesterol/gamma-HCH transport system permease protein|nr:ABC transporter permease [Bacteroidota bacterium]